MAENALRHGPADEKKYPGGQLGEELIRGVDVLKADIRDYADRLSFIASGLRDEDPAVKGAELAIIDVENSMWSSVDTAESLPEKARKLAKIAENGGYLLPETPSEVALFKALKEARGMADDLTPRDFMCKAALEAFKVYKDKYIEPYPHEEAVAAVVEATMEKMPQAEAPGQGEKA